MDINLHEATIALPRQAVTTLRGARGLRLVAVTGSLWITQDGDRRDYFLESGEDLDVTTDGAVVVQAQADSRLAVLRPAAVRIPLAPAGAARKPRSRIAALLSDWLGPDRIDHMVKAARLRGI